MSDISTKPHNFALGAFLSVLAIPLAIASAVIVGLLGTGVAAAVAAIGMFAAFQLFALGSRGPVSRGRDFLFALVVGAIATVLGALAGLLTDAYSSFVAGGGTSGILENLFAGRVELPFPSRPEEVVVPLTITAVLAILAVVMNAAKALAVHRDNIMAKANAVATSATSHLETSRTALTSSAKNSANAANQFANHVMTINTSSPGILLNGKPLGEQDQTKNQLLHRLRELIDRALRG
ncbi:hypothetical protein [Salinibacterium sp. M195]|uniref:hypothetical protein n=1 Tax=Salinibacterium sp. M195 TaxID=2583374 RepID=UPI001C635208|nr:hypothetical protein [Salinibacterium sp. M195]QYH35292.1 hypothetical protein FFT87_04630 [Salinibacterium sp. M195]